VAGVVCALGASAKGERGCFSGANNAGTLALAFGAGRVYTMLCQPGYADHARGAKPTLREETGVPIASMLAQEPPISKLVVSLEKLHTVAFRQSQLIGTAGLEVICGTPRVSH
jgi:hypothetical protein